MPQLNQTDLDGARQAAVQALLADDASGLEATAVQLTDIKQFFCENWPMVKKVLQFLADQLGGLPKMAAKALIAAGDYLYGRIC